MLWMRTQLSIVMRIDSASLKALACSVTHSAQVTLRTAAILLSFTASFSSRAHAQQADVREVLRAAYDANWTVRVLTAADTVEGHVSNVFRETARIGRRTLPISEVTRIERRRRNAWSTVWPVSQSIAPAQDSITASGGSVVLFVGTIGAVFPGVFIPLPPPLYAGIQLAARDMEGEFTFNARMLAYPFPTGLFSLDAGRNIWHRNRRSYGGASAGMIARFENQLFMEPMFGARFGKLPPGRSGSRVEMRADALLAEGVVILLSLQVGFDQSFGN
jgi:hypothetical protein